MVTRPGRLNLGVRLFSADLEGGDLAGWTKNKRLMIFLYQLARGARQHPRPMWQYLKCPNQQLTESEP